MLGPFLSKSHLMVFEGLDLENERCDAKREGSGQGEGRRGHRDVPAQLPVLDEVRNS